MTTPKKYSLSKKERLKSRTLINNLFESGHHEFKYPLKVLFKYEIIDTDSTEASLLFSVTVPKKLFKLAIDRNKIKRRIREAYRNNKLALQTSLVNDDSRVLYLMFIYVAKDIAPYEIIEKSIKSLLSIIKSRAM